MNKEIILSEQLESYFKGTMSSTERLEFESKLTSDQSLQEQLSVYEGINELVVDAAVLDLKYKLKRGNYHSPSNWKKWTLWGVAFIIGIAGVYLGYRMIGRESKNDLNPENFAVIPIEAKGENGKSSPNISSNATKSEASKIKSSRSKKEFSIIEKDSVTDASVNSVSSPNNPNVNSSIDVLPNLTSKSESKQQEVDHYPEVLINNQVQKESRKDVETATKDYLFQPGLGESWSFPIDGNESGEIKIFDSNGQMVLNSPLGQGYPKEWNGNSQQGGGVMTGNYLYIITFESNKVIQGYVTVVR